MRNTKLILNFIAAVAIISFGLYLAIMRAVSPLEKRVSNLEYRMTACERNLSPDSAAVGNAIEYDK